MPLFPARGIHNILEAIEKVKAEEYKVRENEWINALNKIDESVFKSLHISQCPLKVENITTLHNIIAFSEHYGSVDGYNVNDFILNVYTMPTHFVYVLTYANVNQTLKNAIESASIVTSSRIPEFLRDAGYAMSWLPEDRKTPKLAFWEEID